MTKEIQLSKGNVALVDDEDYELLMTHKWKAMKSKGGALYAARNYFNGKWGTILMHRFITNAPDDKCVDHINANTLDNRRCNLRICSKQENSFNRKMHSTNTSGYKGVTWNKSHGKWVAQIKHDGKIMHLGDFSDIDDAARAYDRKAIELYGEFARTNFSGDQMF